MFNDQIGKTMEVYIDHMLVKSVKEEEHLKRIEEAFAVLRSYGIKLNPTKCTFRVRGGKFLGFMVNVRKIKTNLEKIKAILEMSSPKIVKDVQKLMGRISR